MMSETPTTTSDESRVRQTRLWAMILHLSMLAGFVVPLAGLIAPIVIWQVKKTDLSELDLHGRIAANWILSALIYAVISAVLVIVVVGALLLIILGVLSIVFPIVAGVKANNGEAWRYPLSIRFFKLPSAQQE